MWPRLGAVPTYGVLYGVGILLHFIISYLVAKRLGLRRRVWIAVSICYLIGMTAGAKALYDLQHGEFDLRALLTAEHYGRGGLWGGLLAYLVLAVPLALVLAKHRWAALDVVGLSIPIPWTLAKLGCLFNGCCYGRACSMPWAIRFPEAAAGAPADLPIHPTQIYEVLVVMCILLVFKILKGEQWKGSMLLWFLILYGFGRAFTDLWRGDVDREVYFGPFSLSQLICLVAAGISVLVLYLRHRRRLRPPPTCR
jgi:phosphatidylglycerol:prolipoprotein diacylglycerol transferase